METEADKEKETEMETETEDADQTPTKQACAPVRDNMYLHPLQGKSQRGSDD